MEKIAFTFLNETPGALRFQEVDADGDPVLEGAKVGAFYVRKDQAGKLFPSYASEGKAPERIEITVAEVQ